MLVFKQIQMTLVLVEVSVVPLMESVNLFDVSKYRPTTSDIPLILIRYFTWLVGSVLNLKEIVPFVVKDLSNMKDSD